MTIWRKPCATHRESSESNLLRDVAKSTSTKRDSALHSMTDTTQNKTETKTTKGDTQ